MRTDIIAVIDDNRTWLETVSEVLSQEGFQVQAATNGDDAIELLDRIQPKLIILDVHLSGTSGLHVLHDFRNRDRTTPVLVVSGDDRASIRDQAMTDGASGFLQKPLPSAILLRAVRRFMQCPAQSDGAVGHFGTASEHFGTEGN